VEAAVVEAEGEEDQQAGGRSSLPSPPFWSVSLKYGRKMMMLMKTATNVHRHRVGSVAVAVADDDAVSWTSSSSSPLSYIHCLTMLPVGQVISGAGP
jgi:hypothetical protein